MRRKRHMIMLTRLTQCHIDDGDGDHDDDADDDDL